MLTRILNSSSKQTGGWSFRGVQNETRLSWKSPHPNHCSADRCSLFSMGQDGTYAASWYLMPLMFFSYRASRITSGSSHTRNGFAPQWTHPDPKDCDCLLSYREMCSHNPGSSAVAWAYPRTSSLSCVVGAHPEAFIIPTSALRLSKHSCQPGPDSCRPRFSSVWRCLHSCTWSSASQFTPPVPCQRVIHFAFVLALWTLPTHAHIRACPSAIDSAANFSPNQHWFRK